LQFPSKTPPAAETNHAHLQELAAAASAETDPIDFQDMATEQATCPVTQRLIAGGSSLKIEFQDIPGHRLAGDSSRGLWRPLVPPKHRQAVFPHFHGIAHPGRLATCRLISSRFVWPGLSKDVTAWARECTACQRSKIHRHFQVRQKRIPVPQRRFAHIHIDLVGPLNPSNGFNHILTVIDRTSCWMEAIPLANTAAVRRHYFQGGFAGLVSQPSSHLTEEHNLLLIFGTHCVFCYRSNTSPQLPTTHRPTEWWKGYTAA
jgi:hypothetical protein